MNTEQTEIYDLDDDDGFSGRVSDNGRERQIESLGNRTYPISDLEGLKG